MAVAQAYIYIYVYTEDASHAYPGTPFFFKGVVCSLLLQSFCDPLPLLGVFNGERPRFGDCLARIAEEVMQAVLPDRMQFSSLD